MRVSTAIKLILEQMTFRLWEKTWLTKKTGRELYAICSKSTKKALKLYKGLCKTASALIVQTKIEKIGLKNFWQFRKVPGFNLPKCLCRQEM